MDITKFQEWIKAFDIQRVVAVGHCKNGTMVHTVFHRPEMKLPTRQPTPGEIVGQLADRACVG